MSASPLSTATQVTRLLCSPLRAGRNKDVQPLSMAVETWQSAGVWITGRSEPDYPQRLHRLKQNPQPMETADLFALHEAPPEYRSGRQAQTLTPPKKRTH